MIRMSANISHFLRSFSMTVAAFAHGNHEGGGCPPTFGGTSSLLVIIPCRYGLYMRKQVPPRGWRNLPFAPFREWLAEPSLGGATQNSPSAWTNLHVRL